MAFVNHPGNNYGESPVGKEGGSYSKAPHPITDSMPSYRESVGFNRPPHNPLEPTIVTLPDAGPAAMAASALIGVHFDHPVQRFAAIRRLIREFQWQDKIPVAAEESTSS